MAGFELMANNLHRAKPVRKPIPVSLRAIMKRLKIDNPSYLLDFARRVRDVESSGGIKRVPDDPNSNARGTYQWMTSDFGKGENKGTIESATHNLIKSYNKEGIEIPDWLLSLDRNAGILRQNTGYIKTLTQEDWQNQVLDLKPHMEDALFWSYLDQQPGTDEKWLTITYGNDTPWPKKSDKPRYWGMLDAYTQNHHRGGEKVEKEKFRDVNIRKKFDLPAYHKDENPFQPALPMSDIRLDEELHAPYQLYELPTLLNEEPILRGIPEEIRMNTGLKSLQRQSGGSMTRGYLEKEVYDPWKFITADTGEYILDFYTGEKRRLDPMERNIQEMKYRNRLEIMPTWEGVEYGDNWWNDYSLPIYNENRIKEAEERAYRARVMEAQHRGAEILPHNRRFGGLVSLANGGNPYEDMVEDAMYESPQESYESRQDDSSAEETSLPYNLAPDTYDPFSNSIIPSGVKNTAAMEDAYPYQNWAGIPLYQEAGATIPSEQINLLRSYDPAIQGVRPPRIETLKDVVPSAVELFSLQDFWPEGYEGGLLTETPEHRNLFPPHEETDISSLPLRFSPATLPILLASLTLNFGDTLASPLSIFFLLFS